MNTIVISSDKQEGLKKSTNVTTAIKQEQKEPVKPKTIEELQKENEELKRKLLTVPEDLEKKIEYFNRKRLLIKRFDALSEKKNNLLIHLDQVAELSAKNDFSNDRYSIVINNAENGYNFKEIFKIQNPVVIGEVINFMISKVEAIQTDLQKQIEE